MFFVNLTQFLVVFFYMFEKFLFFFFVALPSIFNGCAQIVPFIGLASFYLHFYDFAAIANKEGDRSRKTARSIPQVFIHLL